MTPGVENNAPKKEQDDNGERARRRRAAPETSPSSSRTAFRNAEYLYKLRFREERRSRGARKKGSVIVRREPLRLSPALLRGEVVRAGAGVVVPGDERRDGADDDGVMALPSGAHILRSFLSVEEQEELVRYCLEDAPSPPAPSNHTAHLGEDGVPAGLFAAAVRGDVLDVDGSGNRTTSAWRAPTQASMHGRSAAELLKKLRWVALGPPYDWTRRAYGRPEEEKDSGTPSTLSRERALPACLKELGIRAVAASCGDAMPRCWEPDAALVNYYGAADTLMGHVDDAEPDLRKPIVALCLGRPAVFLIGAETREEEPVAFLVFSGDAVVLSGRARRCFHGVPRIIASADELELPAAAMCDEDDHGTECHHGWKNERVLRVPEELTEEGCREDFVEYARRLCRISISVRDVR